VNASNQTAPTLNGVTISTGSTVDIPNNNILSLAGTTVTNNGNINIQSSGNNTLLTIPGATTLSGTGTVTMSNSTANVITGGGTLTNDETIQGGGDIGDANLTFVNTGTVDANVPSALTINPNGTTTNTGKLEATAGGTLILTTYAINNAGGTILATGTGSTIKLDNLSITGGTLTSSSGGVFESIDPSNQAGPTLTNLTISSGTMVDIPNNDILNLGIGTVTNSGTINIQSSNNSTQLHIDGNVTLAGTGKVIMSANGANVILGTGTLTNENTIEGEGNIGDAEIAVVNEGTIEANIAAGGTLYIDTNGTGFTNNVGTKNGIVDVLAKNTLIIEGGPLNNYSSATNTLTGGEYETAGTLEFNAGANGIETNDAIIILTGTTASILNTGASNVSALVNFSDNGTKGSFTVNGGKFTDTNSFTNSGILSAGSGGTIDLSTGLTNFNSTTNTLTGGTYNVTGTLEFPGANIVVNNAIITLTGTAPKILNSTTSLSALTGFDDNKGTFTVNGGTFTDANSFTNTGTLAAGAKGLFNASGGLTNFNNTNGTLTGGSYTLTTTGQIQFNNEGFANDIVTNDAKITLAGVDTTVSPFIDQNGANALLNFATNGASGSLLLTTDRNFTNTGSLTNAGIVNVEISSGTGKTELIIGGPGVYTQTGGTTIVDGVLSASGGINIQGGFLYGNALTKTGTEGTLIGAVDLTGGTLNPGNAAKLLGTIDITGTYTEGASGTLNIDLDGTVAGTKYDVLNVSGAAALGGTIDFVLNSAFKPVVGDTWDVLNYASETGSFTTVDLPTAPTGDHYSFTCGATDCILSLLSGPAAQPASKGAVSGDPATRVSRNAGAVTSTTTHEPSAILAKATCFAGRLLGSGSCGREAAATVASSGEAHAASSGAGEVHNNIMVATHSVSAGRGAALHETSASAMARLYVCAYFPASVGHTMGCN
jgi:fibronectin-binding autotransporter adhesin